MNVKDTCMPFKYKLHKALNEAGFLVFRDDNDLEDEEDIRSQLFTAIEKSWISIVVFSRNYFYSSCCLEELVKILEWRENSGHKVLPVFYDVEPSEIMHQTRSVGEAFVRYEKKSRDGWREKVNVWRDAITEVSMLSGLSCLNFDEGSMSDLIQQIIAAIRNGLHLTALSNNYTVGLHSRAKSINLWLHDKSSTVQILVVCGVVGIGKSAIAKFVYDSNQHFFESRIFLADIRKVVSENSDGLRILQKQIMSCLSNGTEEQAYGNWENMTRKVKDAICRKRVFVVLDDVSDEGQFYELLGTETFFPGSKIIVTTTSSQMLILSANEVYKVYMVSPLNDDESLELLSWYAFGQDHPKQVYIEQSVRAVEQCRGIPKSLKFLGSLLFGRIDHKKWEDKLKSFGAISETTFAELLKLSYDSLQNEHDKVLFLHIACFFVGEDKDFAVEILNKCGFFTSIGIQNLVDRGLLFINKNKLMMREGFQQMGRDIVRRESPNPGQRTLLWHHKTSFDVVKNVMGSPMIKGLALDMLMFNEEKLRRPTTDVELKEFLDNTLLSNRVISDSRITSEKSYLEIFINWLRSEVSKEVQGGLQLSISALSRMENLELLKLNYVHLAGGYNNFPKNLRWLSWVGFSLKVIPSNLPLSNVVALDMRSSKLEKVWEKHKYLPSLKFMDLSHSCALASTPDFSGIPNLERLYLKGCVSLVIVHDSICDLDGLVELDLEDCKSLKKLPKDFVRLERCLEKLVLDGCSNLAEFGTGGGTWTRGNRLECIQYYP